MPIDKTQWVPEDFDRVTDHVDDRVEQRVWTASTRTASTGFNTGGAAAVLARVLVPESRVVAGSLIRFWGALLFSGAGGAATFQMQVKIGGNIDATDGTIVLRNVAHDPGAAHLLGFAGDVLVTDKDNPSSVTAFTYVMTGAIEATPTIYTDYYLLAAPGPDSTIGIPVKAIGEWSAGVTTDTATLQGFCVQVFKPNAIVKSI